MTDIAVTTNTIAARGTKKVVTASPATSSVANAAEVFVFTPTRGADQCVVLASVANSHGSVTYSIAAGDFWAGDDAGTGSFAQNTMNALIIDTAQYLQSDGTIVITCTPAENKRMATDHVFTFYLIELSKA